MTHGVILGVNELPKRWCAIHHAGVSQVAENYHIEYLQGQLTHPGQWRVRIYSLWLVLQLCPCQSCFQAELNQFR